MNLALATSEPDIGRTRDDGSLIISVDQLARFGGGDAKRGRRELRVMIGAEITRMQPSVAQAVKPATVRLGVMEDEPALYGLVCLALREEDSHNSAPIDRDRVMAHLRQATRMQSGLIGVIGNLGAPVAFVLLLPEQWWWSSAFCIRQKLLFVHPEHRHSDHVDDLLAWSRWATDYWSTKFGYRIHMLMDVLGVHRMRQKVVLYRRKFACLGNIFVYPDPNGGGT